MPSPLSVTVPARRVRRRTPHERAAAAGEPFPLRRRARNRLPFAREMRRSTLMLWVLGLTLAGAALRLAVGRDLSVDEILTVDQAQRSFSGLITLLIHRGTHPPLDPVLEWCAVHLAGAGGWAVRAPSLAAGIALVPAVAALAGEIFDRPTAVVAGALSCVAPALIWYSQEASGYVLVALFGTLALLGAARAARTDASGDWILHAVAGSLAVWSDWSGILILLATEPFLIAGIVRRRRATSPVGAYLARWALDTFAIACQLVVLGLLFADQLHGSGGLTGVTNVAASGVSFYSSVSNASWALFGFHPSTVTSALSAVWPLAMLASLLLVGRGTSPRGWLLLGAVLIPAIGVLVLGVVVPTAYDVRYALAAVPAVLVLLARLAVAWPRGKTGRILICAIAIVVLGGALVDQQLDPSNPRRYDYGRALSRVRADTTGRPHSLVLYAPGDLRVVLARDGRGLQSAPLTTRLPSRRAVGDVFVLSSSARSAPTIALMNRELGALRSTRHLVRFQSDPGVDVWWFR